MDMIGGNRMKVTVFDSSVSVTSPEQVVEYLTRTYKIETSQAKELVKKYDEIVQDSIRIRSYIYYPGDQIAITEGLQEREEGDTMPIFLREWLESLTPERKEELCTWLDTDELATDDMIGCVGKNIRHKED
jgi:hypothetical protein